MEIDPITLSITDNYKLLNHLAVPHPIAWVTAQDKNGAITLAPVSFFNLIGSNPHRIIFSITENDSNQLTNIAKKHSRQAGVCRQLSESRITRSYKYLDDKFFVGSARTKNGESEHLAILAGQPASFGGDTG